MQCPSFKGRNMVVSRSYSQPHGSWWVDKSQAWTTQHTHRHMYIYIYLAYYSTCRPNNAYMRLNAHICIQHIHNIYIYVRVCVYFVYIHIFLHTHLYYKSLMYFQHSPCFMASWWPQAWHSVPPASRVPGRRSDRSTATPRRNGENTKKIRRNCINKCGNI